MQNRKGIRLTDKQRLHWLQLIRSENVGAVTFMSLIEHYGSAEKALCALPELSSKGGAGKPIRVASREDAERELDAAHKIGVQFVGVGEPEYPPLLRATDNPPPLITIKGNPTVFQKPSVGIVGSRNASAPGKKITFQFAKSLGELGFSIVSGLARGIDSAAHSASLSSGTIAVLAGGIDHIYPPENTRLYQEIIEQGGAIISEMPIGWQPRAVDFPRRNRIIAGLSLGLLVVEAAARSGSLITARLAAEIGRIVFAIPGSPLDPRAAGPNHLIRDGALLVTNASDLAETLTPLTPSTPQNAQYSFFESPAEDFLSFPSNNNEPIEQVEHDSSDNELASVLSALSTTPIDIETLCMYSGVPLQRMYLLLIELDLAGKLIRHSGGYVSLSVSDYPD